MVAFQFKSAGCLQNKTAWKTDCTGKRFFRLSGRDIGGGGRLAAHWQTPKGLLHWGGWYLGY